MQKLFLLFLLLTIGSISSAQKLSIDELENLVNKNSTEEISRYFLGKNWLYDGTENGDSEYEKTVTWYFGEDGLFEDTRALVVLYTFIGSPEMIVYGVYDEAVFNTLREEVKDSDYERYDKDSVAGSKKDYYENLNFYVHLSESIIEYEDSEDEEILYDVRVKKRGGHYDPRSGAKKEYYEDGTLKQSYHVVDGEFDGLREFYTESGKLEISVNYENDLENGKFTHYFYDDNGEGELVAKEAGSYYQGHKDGIWNFVYLGDNEYRILQSHTYVDGIKDGDFQEAQGDSLVLGTYKMGDLDGKYRVYLDIERYIAGGILETDTTQLLLLISGNYSVGKRSGRWWVFNYTFVSEGDYFNGKKTGEWNYHYVEEENDEGEVLPFSNQLFLTENYSNDRLNGVRKRYWYEYEEIYPCSEKEKELAESDTCYRTVYEQVFETSYYRSDERNGLYELTDDDDNIILKGYYVNGVKDGGWIEVESLDDNGTYQIESEGFYNRGLKEGDWTETLTIYDENSATVTCTGKYDNNVKHGRWDCFDYEKTHILTANYQSGELEGESTFWYDKETPERVLVFDQGKLNSLTEYNRENIEQSYIQYHIDKLTSSLIEYTKTSKVEGALNSQQYTMINDFNKEVFENSHGTFTDLNLANYWHGDKGFANGSFKKYNELDMLIESGKRKKEKKIGTWITYFYDQNIRIEVEYEFNKPSEEKYIEIESGKPFSGTLTSTDQEANTRETRSIKKGVRDGKTRVYSLVTDKLIKKEDYKEGVLQ
jgi:antitoxin component YwqK of YwqJK toxin-antitoxin module